MKLCCFHICRVKAKLLEKAVAQIAPNNNNGILKDVAITISLKYIGNFWRSLEMRSVNYNVELKLKWTKHCVLVAAGNGNIDANPNNVHFLLSKTQSYMSLSLHYQ